jgi:hypothetical protein
VGVRHLQGKPGGTDLPRRGGKGDDLFTISVLESHEAYDAFASGFKETLGEAGFEG